MTREQAGGVTGAEPLRSAIAEHTADGVTVRGLDLVRELVGRRSYTESLYLLLCGRLPTPGETAVLDACLVTLMEAGINASSVVARVTAAARPGAPQAAIAAGLLTVGDRYVGSSQACGDILAAAPGGSAERERYCREVVDEHRARRAALPGFGHGTHADEDPRATRLREVATAAGVAGTHVAVLDRLSEALDAAVGRHVVLNVTGAMAAVLLDAGVPCAALTGIGVVSRCGGLAGHVLEEAVSPAGDRMWKLVRDSVAYGESSGPTEER
jgi:citrate synthase